MTLRDLASFSSDKSKCPTYWSLSPENLYEFGFKKRSETENDKCNGHTSLHKHCLVVCRVESLFFSFPGRNKKGSKIGSILRSYWLCLRRRTPLTSSLLATVCIGASFSSHASRSFSLMFFLERSRFRSRRTTCTTAECLVSLQFSSALNYHLDLFKRVLTDLNFSS